MANIEELKHRMVGYAFLTPLTDDDFNLYQNYNDRDFRALHFLPVAIICIFEITNIILEFCETDCYDNCMMDFLITPSQESLITIIKHLQIEMQFSRSEALPIVLQHHFQSENWVDMLTSSQNLTQLVETIMKKLSGFELLDWSETIDKKVLEENELKNLYPSFLFFSDAALNIYADNVGFEPIKDNQLFQHTQNFLSEILNYKKTTIEIGSKN